MADTVGPSGQPIPVGKDNWTPEHLYIHLTGKIEDLKSSLGDLRTADHIALNAALAAAKEAVAAALSAQEKATEKYEREIKEWRQASNEWRGALNDRDVRFVEQATLDAQIKGMNQRVDSLDGKIDDLTRSRDLAAGRQTAQTAILAFVFAAVTIGLRFI